ncbi:MAG: lipid-A-disaccharide synthase [Candidatus Omnitrophica bacterium]|nr:lipid-A-disaccharide synthase [Candidatus Omnitrophota bacterium]
MDPNKISNIFISAGEPSGDVRGGELLAKLKKSLPNTKFWGIGGDAMSLEGARLIEHIKNLSLVGVWEVIINLHKIRSQFKNCANSIKKNKPALAILIDYPGFNLRLAKYLHEEHIPVVYYIIPQVWAWGEHRTRAIKKYVSKVIVLFEFEKEFLKKYGIDAELAGHPLADAVLAIRTDSKNTSSLNVALLPGSRKQEILGLLPVMLASGRLLKGSFSRPVEFTLAENSNVDSSVYDKILSGYKDLDVARVKNNTLLALSEKNFALIASGTATLEGAASNTPFVIVYKVSPLTAVISRIVMKIPYIGLVNIVAGKMIVPEILQENATPENISAEILSFLENPERLEEMRKNLKSVYTSLGEKGVAERAASFIVSFIRKL